MYPLTIDNVRTQLQVNTFIRSVYNWMAIGLAITGLMAYYVARSEVLLGVIFGNRLVFFSLIIAELALVFSLVRKIGRIRVSTATGLFLLYSALNGITLSAVLLIYTRESIYSTFFIAAMTFVVCSIFGMRTRRDLTSLGGFMTMGLIGILIASVVNFFIGSSTISVIIGYIGVIVFVGLTAYDTQKLKAMAMSQPAGLDGGTVRKGAVVGALTLYLDFINLFLMLLYVLGGSRK